MAKIEFELFGTIPSKKNNKRIIYSKKHKRQFIISSEKYLKWQKASMFDISRQLGHHPKVKFPIHEVEQITVYLYYGARHRKDNTNAVESVHDLLVDAHIIEDDCWQVMPDTRQIGIFREKDPGCKIVMTIKD